MLLSLNSYHSHTFTIILLFISLYKSLLLTKVDLFSRRIPGYIQTCAAHQSDDYSVEVKLACPIEYRQERVTCLVSSLGVRT
jgi:hypothetical protein